MGYSQLKLMISFVTTDNCFIKIHNLCNTVTNNSKMVALQHLTSINIKAWVKNQILPHIVSRPMLHIAQFYIANMSRVKYATTKSKICDYLLVGCIEQVSRISEKQDINILVCSTLKEGSKVESYTTKRSMAYDFKQADYKQ